MKKLLLSVAILVGATLILSQDKSENIKDVVKDEIVNIQTELQSES
jgi:sensor domain CHASE-containing protein